MKNPETVVVHFVDVSYVTITGAGGSIRMDLANVPNWLAENTGTLIVRLDVLHTKTYGI